MMQFDERLLRREHIDKAIHYYIKNNPDHPKARSAFLIHEGLRLPAKFILRLAYKEATGHMPPSESLTGGRASVRVLKHLGYDGIYEKIEGRINRNAVKNARRNAFKDILASYFGKVEIEKKFPGIQVPDLSNRNVMDKDLRSILNCIESVRGMKVKGQACRLLSFDFYIPTINIVIEFDERQHFTLPRAASLQAYPVSKQIGFDGKRWIQLCQNINAGDNSPEYRDEQRAFYDAIRDIMAPRFGLKPIVRIYEADVCWEKEGDSSPGAKTILDQIRTVA